MVSLISLDLLVRNHQERYFLPLRIQDTSITLSQHGPEVSIDETWIQLSTNIKEIFNHHASDLSFEENHRFAYNMVLYRQGARLYDGVKKLIVENLDRLSKEQVIPAFPTGSAQDTGQRTLEGERLLRALTDVWEDHYSGLSKLRDILKYMVRHRLHPPQKPLLISGVRTAFIPQAHLFLSYGTPDFISFSHTSYALQ